MKSRLTVFALPALALAALAFFAAGCDRMDNNAAPQTAETDEPGFRRARELERQDRNQEAISELENVLDKRGLNNAPETHLELGLLYQQHMRDPLAALYHFQKYLQLKPHSDREDLVRQRIEAAKREYASTLPGRPSLDAPSAGVDMIDLNNKLQTENDQLRAALKAALGNNPAAANAILSSAPAAADDTLALASALAPMQSRQAPQPLAPATAVVTAQPARQPQQQAQQPPPPRQQPAQQPRATGRAYVVRKGDSLFTIARQAYGSATNARIEAIVNANRDALPSGRNTILREGMTLKLP